MTPSQTDVPGQATEPELERPRHPTPDWDSLTFAFTQTDAMYRSFGEFKDDKTAADSDAEIEWDAGTFAPFRDLNISAASAFMSYGVGIFEGLQAPYSADGRVLLFRHRDNGLRFQRSAERLMMATFPVDQFVEAVEELVRKNMRFIPPHGKGTLYVRPIQHAIETKLGLGPCSKFWVLMYCSPVGGYFASKDSKGPSGVRLRVLRQGRVAPGGTGDAKAMGNYAGGIALAQKWRAQGYNDVLYLDAHELRYLTETSGSNVFVKLKSGPVVTPPLDDQILPGITRDSAATVAREVLGLDVQERPLPIEEVLDEGEEMFCTGTAWTVQSVSELVHEDGTHKFQSTEIQEALLGEIRSYQTGEKEDPFGWVTEVKE